ncbi:hypothetical protein [Aquimarina longa]|uniref:hypothetical protein n=1 Tax=Aquimarina longa TaxID=1080221 RepID=UPI00078629E8|nr:hypothetical protein [Aquimarina longa]
MINGGKVDFDDEVILDSSFVNSKGKCVFDYIKQTSGSLFRNTIRNFIDNKEYDLKMIVEPLNDANELSTAITSDDQINQGIIKIKFNSKIVNTINPLEWAATILHEGIHAEIYRFVHKNDPTVKPTERARIIQLYLFYKNIGVNDGVIDTYVQHNHISQKYVIPIAKALRELGKNQYPLDDYMYFPWEDLLGDEIAKELKPSKKQLSIWLNKSIKIRDKNNIPCN